MRGLVIPFAESDIRGRCLDCGAPVEGEASIVSEGGRQTIVSVVITTQDGGSHTVARTEAVSPRRVPYYVQPGGHT